MYLDACTKTSFRMKLSYSYYQPTIISATRSSSKRLHAQHLTPCTFQYIWFQPLLISRLSLHMYGKVKHIVDSDWPTSRPDQMHVLHELATTTRLTMLTNPKISACDA